LATVKPAVAAKPTATPEMKNLVAKEKQESPEAGLESPNLSAQ
jgi:hypothetical protein